MRCENAPNKDPTLVARYGFGISLGKSAPSMGSRRVRSAPPLNSEFLRVSMICAGPRAGSWLEAILHPDPFGGPGRARHLSRKAVLAYLSHYTHRVAIANSRLLAFNDKGVTFKCKDYRIEGPGRYKTMTLATDEFIRRFLIHVLPTGFHRIRHYGLLAKSAAANNIVRARQITHRAKAASRAHRYPSVQCHRPVCLRADLSPLWRTHDHHRDIRTRFDATLSTARSNHRH